jgi:hypothetical protein
MAQTFTCVGALRARAVVLACPRAVVGARMAELRRVDARRSRMNWLLAAATLLLPPSKSVAPICAAGCTCVWERDVSRAKERAAAVLEAVALDSTLGAPVTDSTLGFVTVRLAVGQVWKGELADTLGVVTRDPGSTCGFSFVRGERYLVFAYRTAGGELEVSMCSPSQSWVQAKRARRELGRPLRAGAA